MFTDLKPYPEYSRSGADWLGPFPVHWNVRRAKYLFRDIDVRSKTGHQQQLSVSHLTGVSPRSMKTVTMFKAVSYVGHKTCLSGDLVVNTMWAWMGALGIAREAGIVSPAYNVYRRLRDSGVNVEFVAVQFRTPTYIAYFRSHSTGLRPSRLRFYPDELLATPALLPPGDEQAAIVKYLGHANARIDRAIAAKRKLMGLLAEQNQAIINQAVTRGLDPSVALKDSGLPWLGEIPAHWDVFSTGAASLLIQTGPFGSQLHAEEYIDGGVPVINPSHLVATGIVPDPAVSLRQSKVTELARHCLKHGDVIAARRGELGRCAVVGPREVGWLCGTGSLIIRLRSVMFCPSYFQLFFSAQQTKAQLEAGSVGATMSNLNAQMVGRLRIPKPPFEEQRAIVEAVELLTRRKAAEVEKVLREIELLREFKTRLTADVVTGQLDIRDAAARLPDLDPADLVGNVGEHGEDDLDAELAESLEAVDA